MFAKNRKLPRKKAVFTTFFRKMSEKLSSDLELCYSTPKIFKTLKYISITINVMPLLNILENKITNKILRSQ